MKLWEVVAAPLFLIGSYLPYFNKPAAQVQGDSPSWSSLSRQTAIIILLRLSIILMISLLGLGFLHSEAGKVKGLSGLKNIFLLHFNSIKAEPKT